MNDNYEEVAILTTLLPDCRVTLALIHEATFILHGILMDVTNNQPFTISSIVWQVSDVTTTRSYRAVSSPQLA